MSSPLPSYPFKIRYTRTDDLVAGFFLPVFERAVSYDRLVGLASPEALAGAAIGIHRLLLRGGRVRFLCGVRLTAEDTSVLGEEPGEAKIVEALLRDLAPPADAAVRGRLEAVAWMLAHRHLELRFALPRDAAGVPLEERAARVCWEPPEAVVRDADGHRLAWSGGESFWTFASFPRGEGKERIAEAPSHVQAVARRFDSLWEGRTPGWRVLDPPSPVRDRLLSFCPAEAPLRDPLEKAAPTKPARAAAAVAGVVDERLLFRFLREAPRFPDARDLGVATGAVEPWPHQLRLVRRVVAAYPRSFLFCDEVGLGKTVEAGLALRQLLVSGRVSRALILVPKNVLRQWQEELYEKAALHVPRYSGGKLYDVFDREVSARKLRRSKNPWKVVPVALASSHLARRRERRAELLRAEPWDLVIVDEAHHARRQDFRPGRFRPNTLLELLAGRGGRRGLKDRTRCLYLLTATPMQVHPVEVWDLLKLCGLGGRWGALEENFLRFFEELRRPFRERDWAFVAEMLADVFEEGAGPDPAFRRAVIERLGEDTWTSFDALTRAVDPRHAAFALDVAARRKLDDMLRLATPLPSFVERNTRQLLRRYRMQGLLEANVPDRRPENVWIPMKDAERALYDRIEAYIADFYRRFEAERRGLGFIMTVYRRRLTSSFYAIRRSLERRLAHLRGEAGPEVEGRSADLFAEDLAEEVEPELFDAGVESSDSEQAKSEEAYLEDFLRDLSMLGRDSKVERLFQDLAALFRERDTVLVFTQYTDTMDHLREELTPVYGERVACYSGRGGELWDGASWKPAPKERIKESFRRGEVRVLLATEAASEGLNLQTCGVLVNFDMPWNPMRVEQRIGRLDRIGQAYADVWIKNYFYADSVEAVVYRRLADRIHWFEQVLGRLQPILHRVGEVIEDVALARGMRRERRLEEGLAALGMELDHPGASGFELSDELFDGERRGEMKRDLETPVRLADLESLVAGSRALGESFAAHPEIRGAYVLTWKGRESVVSFSAEVFDRYPSSVELLTWGHPLFAELLGSVEAPAESEEPGGLGLYSTRSPEPLSLFLHPARATEKVTRLEELRRALETPAGGWSGGDERRAVALFSQARSEKLASLRRAEDERRRAEQRALAEGARQVLRRAAFVALARGRHSGLFDESLPYGFGPEAVTALGRRGAPFAALLAMVDVGTIEIRSDDPYFLRIEGRPPEELQRKAKALVTEGKEVVARHAFLAAGPISSESDPAGVFERTWFPLVDEDERGSEEAQPPFRVLRTSEVEPFENAVPLYDDVEAVGARFGDETSAEDASQVASKGRKQPALQADELENPADYTWVVYEGRAAPRPGLFVTRVTGEAMNRRIPSGSWCVFELAPSAREGKVVLARHLGTVTLGIYESEVEAAEDDSWRPRVVLRPASTDPSFQPVVIRDPEEGGFRILAELVEVLG